MSGPDTLLTAKLAERILPALAWKEAALTKTVIVVSDLHISAGELDDCDEELEQHVIDFIGGLNYRGDSVELVINGDFIDFVQAPPWRGSDLRTKSDNGVSLCFTEQQSLAKLQACIQRHAPIFDALQAFLKKKSDNLVTILPGNHDADFFWPSVQDVLRAAVSGRFPELGSRVVTGVFSSGASLPTGRSARCMDRAWASA